MCFSSEFHQDLSVGGCSHTDSDDDVQQMFSLDQEVYWYADFKNHRGVEPQPDFIGHVTVVGGYEQALHERELCKRNLKVVKKGMRDLPMNLEPPSLLVLYPRTPLRVGEKNLLLCLASGFYPAPVRFFWTVDQRNLSSFTVSQVFLQEDGYFFQLSRLELLPQDGQMYSCRVEHPAVRTTHMMTRFYTVEEQRPSVAFTVFCALGLVLALVGVAVGTFFFIKGKARRC
ncbi:H-2 class II histocompatibility antigen, A-F alpha chain-like [Boleophthalmus pectinirostris]|uniref:H-2 class II histocompatibility antigen, A-F alpha chain-like n=1 Tax=Boleophthalmus pectinirostris TaxID=150288 RepID=UPI0024331C07|nr:H-2 class II histocompatibility antigen, A-F alpha chain-like [Boleophthalmus pectinirostris]